MLLWIDNESYWELIVAGNHYTKSLSVFCPTFLNFGNGLPYLNFIGVNRWPDIYQVCRENILN